MPEGSKKVAGGDPTGTTTGGGEFSAEWEETAEEVSIERVDRVWGGRGRGMGRS